jgi:hypothetical protein
MGLKMGVASSSDCAWVTGHLEQRGLKEYFACVLGADDVELTKPDPGLYLAVLEGMGVKAEESTPFLFSLKSIYNNWRISSKGSCRASMKLSSSGETLAMVLSIAYSW